MTRSQNSTGLGYCGATVAGSRCLRSTKRRCCSIASGTIFSRSTASRQSRRSSSARLVQRAGVADAEPLHETVPDQRRIARRLHRARLVVDLDRQKQRSFVAEAPAHELLEVILVAHPMAVGD